MKKIIQTVLVCIITLCASIVFSGCNWWFGGGDTGTHNGGSGGNGGSVRPGVPTVEEEYIKPEPPKQDYSINIETAKRYAEYYDATIQGVRAVYMPGAYEQSDDEVLQADRDKFWYNASFQYEIVAKYILYRLVGEYGTGISGDSITYEFFADTSLLPEGDETQIVVSLPGGTPYVKGGYLLETNVDAINSPVVNLEYPGTQGVQTIQQVHDDDLHWLLQGDGVGFVNSYYRAVQLYIMQHAVMPGQETYSFGALLGASASTLDEIQHFLEHKIDKLGVPQTGEYAGFLDGFIKTQIIGSELIGREYAMIHYDDPMYEVWEIVGYHWEGSGDNRHQVADYDWVPYYYGMGKGSGPNKEERNDLDSDTAYKFNYVEKVSEIVSEIVGAGGFTQNFPKYNRAEITDIQAYNYTLAAYTEPENEEEEPQIKPIEFMDYREYQSIIVYPDIIKEDQTTPVWYFDYINIGIESINDITLDVYMRIRKNGVDYFTLLRRVTTDSTQNYLIEARWTKEESERAEELQDDPKGLAELMFSKPSNHFITFFGYYIDDDFVGLIMPEGIESSTEYDFYQTREDVYENTFAGKLGSKVSYEKFQKGTKYENVLEEEVDFSNTYACQKNEDFVEFIFDIQKDENNPPDYDYSFKFSVYPCLLNGSVNEDME